MSKGSEIDTKSSAVGSGGVSTSMNPVNGSLSDPAFDHKQYPLPPSGPSVTTITADPFRESMIELPTRNLLMHVVECGPTNGDSGETIVFCHGFPEFWYSWAKQMPILASLGYRCIAPDLRGYGYTKPLKPSEDDRSNAALYSRKEICLDLDALLVVLKINRAIFIGHDLGGAIVWLMARRFPKRVSGVCAICTPFRQRTSEKYVPVEALLPTYPQFYYQIYFAEDQSRLAAEELDADVEHSVKCLLRTSKPVDRFPAPTGSPTGTTHHITMNEGWIIPATRVNGLFRAVPKPVKTSHAFSEHDIQQYIAAFKHSGFRGGLLWYGAHKLNWEQEITDSVPQVVPHPALMITAGQDGILLPSLTRDMEKWIPNMQRAHITESGHWVQYEATSQLNSILTKWLVGLKQQQTVTVAAATPTTAPSESKSTAAAASASDAARVPHSHHPRRRPHDRHDSSDSSSSSLRHSIASGASLVASVIAATALIWMSAKTKSK